MKSRPKDLGTGNETRRVRVHRDAGFHSGRLAEGGAADLGDVWIGEHPDVYPEVAWIEECKARANLNPHQTLHKAIRKAGHMRVLLSHKRLVRKEGAARRVPDGLVEVVSGHPTTIERLLVAHEELRRRDPDYIDDLWSDR